MEEEGFRKVRIRKEREKNLAGLACQGGDEEKASPWCRGFCGCEQMNDRSRGRPLPRSRYPNRCAEARRATRPLKKKKRRRRKSKAPTKQKDHNRATPNNTTTSGRCQSRLALASIGIGPSLGLSMPMQAVGPSREPLLPSTRSPHSDQSTRERDEGKGRGRKGPSKRFVRAG